MSSHARLIQPHKMPAVNVTVGTSPLGPAFLEASIKLPLFGTKTYQVPRADAEWLFQALGAVLGLR